MRQCSLLAVFLWAVCTVPVCAQPVRRPMKVEDLFAFRRVSDPQISPNGKWVAYVVGEVSLERNSIATDLWLAPTSGGEPRRLTTHPKNDRHPRWSPDGKRLLFESNRSGSYQVWVLDMDRPGEPRQLTDIATGAGSATWSPDGRLVAFVSSVWPEYSVKTFQESNALNRKRMEDAEKNPVKARVFQRLFFRHWDSYVEDKREHLFVVPADGGEPRDLTPHDWDANPTSMTFSSSQDFTFSPDGKYILFTAPPKKNEAWSTNYDIWRVPVAGGTAECLTKDNPAADGAPRYSPDGKWLAYRAQKNPGHEADRWQLYVMPADGAANDKRSITAEFDSSVEDFVWAPDGKTIYFIAEEKGRAPVFAASVGDGKVTKLIDQHTHHSVGISGDGKALVLSRSALTFPSEVFVRDLTSSREEAISRANAKLLSELNLPRPESVTVKGAGDTPMQMWIVEPPGFDPKKKWPLAYLVHGGPQGAWNDSWSFRWCPELWAAQGYVVALPNPRGSTGFGQKYVNEISRDWGGKVYDDLMAGVAHLEKQPYIDADRMAAAGASYGGYMMNWFQGHTTKFQTLITHCGVFNFDSMYGTTEELWFDEYEHGGTPWSNPKAYAKWSPHRYVKNFKTPMLIIHNDLDFRVPVSEGIQLFTTLQRLGIPSKMINFPDEGHWVLKPRNSEYWHREVFAWLKKYAPPGGL